MATIVVLCALAGVGAVDKILQVIRGGVWAVAGVPVFGVKLRRSTGIWLRVLPLLAAVPALAFLAGWWRWGAVFALIVCWLASFEDRLPNHCALLALVLITCSLPVGASSSTFGVILAGVYASSGIFKCNHVYLFSDRSPGRLLAADLLLKFGIRPARWLVVALSNAVVLVELLIAAALILGTAPLWALAAASCLHLAFGVIGKVGNFDFSATMALIWLGYLNPEPDATQLLVGVLFAAMTTGIALATLASRWRQRIYLISRAFDAMVFGFFAGYGLAASLLQSKIQLQLSALDLAVAALFLVNVLCVIAGLKLESSFAMFAGIDPRVGWNGLSLVPRPTYYAVTLPSSDVGLREWGEKPHRLFSGDLVASSATVRQLHRVAPELAPVADEASPRRGEWLRERVLLFPPYLPADPQTPYLG